jgi:hypothetical protein
MNMKIVGVILICVGLLLLVYKGITYKTHEKVLDLGPLQVTQEKTNTFPFSPVFGGAALVGGIILVVFSGKRAS